MPARRLGSPVPSDLNRRDSARCDRAKIARCAAERAANRSNGPANRPHPLVLRSPEHRRPRQGCGAFRRRRGALLHAARAARRGAHDRGAHEVGGRLDRRPVAHRQRDRGRRAGGDRVGDDLARSAHRRAAPRPRHRVVRILGRRPHQGGARLLPQRPAQPQRQPARVRSQGARLHRARGQMTAHDPYTLPADLPVPEDDGAAAHLVGMRVPRLELPTTDQRALDLAEAAQQLLVLYVYPRPGRPGEPLPTGWDEIPGARGCTPQACAFRDLHAEIVATGAHKLGLSAQPVAEQAEVVERLGLPYALASDPLLTVAEALRLPTFEVDGMRLYKRLTLIAEGGEIVKVFYPVFPPNRNAEEVLEWLHARR